MYKFAFFVFVYVFTAAFFAAATQSVGRGFGGFHGGGGFAARAIAGEELGAIEAGRIGAGGLANSGIGVAPLQHANAAFGIPHADGIGAVSGGYRGGYAGGGYVPTAASGSHPAAAGFGAGFGSGTMRMYQEAGTVGVGWQSHGLGAFDHGLAGLRGGPAPHGWADGGTSPFAAGTAAMAGLPDTLTKALAGLPSDMGLHAAANVTPYVGYSGSARGLLPAESYAAVTDAQRAFEEGGVAITQPGDRSVTGPATQRIPAGPVGATQSGGVSPSQRATGNAATAAAESKPSLSRAATQRDADRVADDARNAAANSMIHTATANAALTGAATGRAGLAAERRVRANAVRDAYIREIVFDKRWYDTYSDAWLAELVADQWSQPTWKDVNNWFGTTWPTIDYDYGDELVHDGEKLTLYGRPIASVEQYWQAAHELVARGRQSAPHNARWLPLGVFAAVRGHEKSTNMLFQLALDESGTLRGNYFNRADKNVQPVVGAVDKDTQRICWMVADRQDIVFDTGLYNLTQDETAVLVHLGKDKTEHWTLVRLIHSSPSTQTTR